MSESIYCGIYDFELLPYALGDVLTWNVQTASRCEESGRPRIDIYICLDPRYPAGIYQRNLIVTENRGLFFSELFGAFGTHPNLNNIFLFSDRDALIARMREVAAGDPINTEALTDYERVLARRDDEDALNTYFIKYIYSHERLNAFAAARGHIPLLRSSMGCEPDVDGLMTRRLADKRVVVVHPRLRRLDYGMGGDHTYFRDSDFLEWYEFIRRAERTRPEVQFVVVGRLQEKPLELLKLPNVMSLRTLGLGLGHELTLMRKADLFIGTSSGFAAMANFSDTPYFVTRMNKESCNAYHISPGDDRLPFAKPNQFLVYEPETADLLTDLLERGLAAATRPLTPVPARRDGIDVGSFNADRGELLYPASSTCRLHVDGVHAAQETAFLLAPTIDRAVEAARAGDIDGAARAAERVRKNFPVLEGNMRELNLLRDLLNDGPPKLRPPGVNEERARFQPPSLFQRIARGAEWGRALPGRVFRAARRGTLVSGIKRRMADLGRGS